MFSKDWVDRALVNLLFLFRQAQGRPVGRVYKLRFAIDADGTLRALGHESTRGKTPRNFALDPTGRYLLAANQDTSNVAVFRIDAKTGRLELIGEPVEVPRPVCIKMLSK
jgi:6-phosphogluconolactonase (cycloisomerase 2 family)